MNLTELEKRLNQVSKWILDYYRHIEEYPVRSKVEPGQIHTQLPLHAPQDNEDFDQIFHDFLNLIIPGMTHWQHPHFHAYFPATISYPSLLAEMIISTLGAQCMIWDTSPAAAELEQKVLEWLLEEMQLPINWNGSIQDTASTATLAALVVAREKKTDWEINDNGFKDRVLRFYCSSEAHSSIEKAVKILGSGKTNLIKIDVDDQLAMIPSALKQQIETDLQSGYVPCAVIAAVGTTGTLAVDPLSAIGQICKEFNVWLHVDAAYAGTALILPEYKWLRSGIEYADSFVFNPHKWMFTHFDCNVSYFKSKNELLKTYEILPEYLKTKTHGKVNDYRDWGIPLGRRFRALKLWFVIRSLGINGIRKKLRDQIKWTKKLEKRLAVLPYFEILIPAKFNLILINCTGKSTEERNQRTERLLQSLNQSGKIYATHTKVNGIYAIRLVLGTYLLNETHVNELYDWIVEESQMVFKR